MLYNILKCKKCGFMIKAKMYEDKVCCGNCGKTQHINKNDFILTIDNGKFEYEQKAPEKNIKPKRTGIIIFAVLVLLFNIFVVLLNVIVIPQNKINKAKVMIERGDLKAAQTLLKEVERDYYPQRSIQYEVALLLMESEDYGSAYTLFDGIDYKDSKEKANQCLKTFISRAEIGTTVTFGTYRSEDIEWIVIDKSDKKVLLISRYILTKGYYGFVNETWEESRVRKWLNETFLVQSFNEKLQNAIIATNVSADHYYYDSEQGNTTIDKIFLLSANEVIMYLGKINQIIAAPTPLAAVSEEIETSPIYKTNSGEFACRYWLRTKGKEDSSAIAVIETGVFFNLNISYSVGIRPALWLDLESLGE